MFRSSAIVLLAFLAAIATANVIQPRIVGGSAARPGQFKYIASLQTAQNGHICGAAIINARWVITAATCTISMWVGDGSTVRTGSNTHNSGGVVHKVQHFISHPQYNYQTRSNDLALVQTATPIATNANTASIQLPLADRSVGQAEILGWGHVDPAKPAKSTQLQYASVPIISKADCRNGLKPYGFDGYVRETNVCSLGGAGIGICRGDIGGPLAAGNELVGISSIAITCATGAPDVFTNVYSYKQWIEQTAL